MSGPTRSRLKTLIVTALFAASVLAPLHILANDPASGDHASPTPSAAPTVDAPTAVATDAPGSTPSHGPAPPTPDASLEPVQPSPTPAVPPAGDSPSAVPSPSHADPSAAPSAAPSPAPAPPSPSQPAPSPSPSVAPGPVESVPYVITFSGRAAFDERAALLAGAGVSETAAIEQLLIVMVDVPVDGAGERIAGLRANPAVTRMEPDRQRSVEATPDDPLYVDQWALERIGWPIVREAPPAGSSVVAILDTGVDAEHPDLAGSLVVGGASFVEGVAADTDPNGHGTWMAGIVAASVDNGVGVTGAGNGALSVMPITVLGPDGTGRDSDIIAGLVHAVDGGADVILMAFASRGYSDALQSAIDYAWDNGVILVAAVGNDGASAPSYPAGAAGVVGVAATEAGDVVWPASNSGASVFLGAPGAGIVTTATEAEYATISGTSAAAAYVAAAAGLVRAQDDTLSNGAVVARLARTADAVATHEQTGNGLLNLGRAWSDTGTEPVRPAGARAADGGPFVGPYEDPDGNPTDEPPTYGSAAVGYRSDTSNAVGTGVTALAISKPTGTIAGDVMVASIAFRPYTATIAAPTGWTLVRMTDQVNGASGTVATYYRIAGASEPTSYTWTLGTAPTGGAGGIVTFYNISSCATIDVQSGQANNVSALTQDAPSVTTTAANDMLVTTHAFPSSATWSPPAGMTEAVDRASEIVPNTAGISLEMNYQVLGAAGATGIKTATASGDADTGIGHTMALRAECVKTWDGGAGTTNWGDANNWNPNGVPTASDDVSLTGANTININVAAATSDLTLNNAALVLTISSGRSLSVTDDLAITSGTLNTQAAFPTVSSSTTIGAGSTVGYTATTGTQSVLARSYGNLTISGGGTKTLAGTITPAGNLTVSGGTFDLSTFTANRSVAGGTLSVANGATLKIGGTGTLPANYSTHSIGASSTVEFAGTTTAVAALNSSQSYGNLTISGTGVTTAASFGVAGTMNVTGTFTPAAASIISGSGTLTGSGTVKVTRTAATAGLANQYTISNKTLTSLTVEYAGAATQVVTATTYGGLRINNASGVTLAGNATATTLTLISGNVATGVSTLAIASGGTVSRTSGHVVGNLQRAVATGAPTVTFDVGDASGYTPLTVTFASVSTAGTLVGSTSAGDHAQLSSSAIVPARSVNRTWTLAGPGVAYTSYDSTVSFLSGDVDSAASTGSFIMAGYSGGTWTTAGAGARTSTSTQGTGLTAFGTLAVGMPDLGIFSDAADIGGPTLSGTGSHSGGTYTVTASGADIWGVADEFGFVYLAKSGDMRITARVVSVTNTNGWAKAGVMIRETTAAGSMHAFAAITPANGMAFQWRPTTDGTSFNSNEIGLSAPYWVRVTRLGSDLIAERSSDGVSWVQQGTSQPISMTSSVLVGLAFTSHDNATRGTAVFDNVSVTSAPGAVADIYVTAPATTLNVSAADGVLDNDADPEGESLTATLVSTTANGSLDFNGDGSFSYTPNTGFVGTDTFTYEAHDGSFSSASATASIYVIGSVGFQAEDYVSGTSTGSGFTTAVEASALGGESIHTNLGNTAAAGPPAERVAYDVYFPDAGATNTYRLYMRYRMVADSGNNDSAWAMSALDATDTDGLAWDQINDLTLHGDTTYRWVELSASPAGINGTGTFSNVTAGLHSWWFGGREAGLYADAFVFSTAASLDLTGAGQWYLDWVVNDRPVVTDDSYSVNEDASLVVSAAGVLSNDADPEDDSLSASLVTGPTSGALTLDADGTFVYTPTGDFNGTDSFTYRAADRMVDSSGVATVTITVNSVNDVPSFTKGANQAVAEDASAQTVVGWASAISPGPSNESGQAVSFLVTNDNNGLFAAQPAVSPTGTLTYTPAANASGSATVSVRIQDNGGTSNGGTDTSALQTFTISVSAANDAPVNTVPGAQGMAVNDTLVFSSANGNPISVADADAGSSSVRVTLTATQGTATLSATTGLAFTAGDGTADGTMTFSGTVGAINSALAGASFTPVSQFAGSASVQIVTNDQGFTGAGGALSDTDSVSITVTNTNPTGAPDSYATYQDNSTVVAAPGVLANDTDPDTGQTLTVQSPRPLTGPSNGSLTLNADGSFTYTPSAGFVGTDSFTYATTDGMGDSAPVTVTLTVTSTAYVSASAWSSAFSTTRYLDLSFPAYVPVGSTVEGATFRHSYRSFAGGGTACYYFEVWASGALIGTHGSSAAPVSCNSGTAFATDTVALPEVNSVARANALTVRLFVSDSAGGKTEHSMATMGVTYWLGNP